MGCSFTEGPAPQEPDFEASIRWTSYGIPHIRSRTWGGAGYGLAYTIAEDAICVLAEDFATVRGERALYFGATARNIDSDAFHKGLLSGERITGYYDHEYAQTRELIDGYVAGYNRYIADHKENLPASCAGKPWIKSIDVDDTARLAIGVGIRYGLGRFTTGITSAEPGAATTAMLAEDPASVPGSNALGFGRTLTRNGKGILLGNPHYPWHGGSRFHLAHMTIPGELDLMGVGLITTPRIAIGFTRHVAWTHTVSTALRFTLFRLDLAPDDPMSYRLGNEYRPIRPVPVDINARSVDGKIETIKRTIYLTHLGPVLVTEDTPWSQDHAYVIRDVNYENNRGGDQYHDIGAATNVMEIRNALARHQGVSFVNTIAADASGNALYADMSAIPYVTAGQIKRCDTGLSRIGSWRVVVLDGSDPSCDWQEDPDAAAPGLMPPDQQPSLITDTYVSNSNDSHWLSNPALRLEGYSPIIGNEKEPRSLRTRAGLTFVEEVLDRGERITPEMVQELLFNHRHFGAELLLDDILTICRHEASTLDIAAACGILGEWDRKQDIESVGAQVYNELWNEIGGAVQAHLAIPFDVNDPVHTPRGLTVESPATRELVMQGLASALARLAAANVSPLSPWGEVQFAARNGEKIGIPGGNGGAGMYSVIGARLNKETSGYNPIITGNSYIQVVTWDDNGNPVANAILTYSQSPEPDSPHYADQTKRYSKSEWIRLPFTDAEIAADTIRSLELSSD